jgi:hypothetical protein
MGAGFLMMNFEGLHQYYGLSLVDEAIVRKEASTSMRDSYLAIKMLCEHFIAHPDPLVVPVYAFQTLSEGVGDYGTFTYSYDMKRLGQISRDEKDLISNFTDSYNSFGQATLSRIMKDYPRLMPFLEKVQEQDRYVDLHSGNVRVNEDGDYQLIDLEGFIIIPLVDKHNLWFTKAPK